MKVGDLVRIIKSGQIVVYLGLAGGCYEFWHHDWKNCYFAIDTLPPEKYEVISEGR
jgi:hypothetical protein